MTKKAIYIEATPLVGRHISGVGKVLLETARAFDTKEYAEKYSLYLFVPFDERKSLEKFNFKFFKIKVLPWPHKFLSLFSRMRVSPPLDIFLGKGVYIFENFRNWNLLFSKSITYIHDIAFIIHPTFVEERNLKFLNKYLPLWLSRTNRIVTVSESSKNEIEKYLHVKNVEVVVNAEDSSMFRQSDEAIAKVREKYSLPEKYCLYLGNIEPRKNLVNTIKGFSEFAKDHKEYGLVIVGGDGWKNEDVKSAIENAKKRGIKIVKPSVFIPDADIPSLVSGAAALLQFSWHEGFGLSVLHAIACGVPVAASDIPSLREIESLTRSSSVVYSNPNDISGISSAIAEAVKLPKNASATVLKWEDSVKSLEAVIEAL